MLVLPVFLPNKKPTCQLKERSLTQLQNKQSTACPREVRAEDRMVNTTEGGTQRSHVREESLPWKLCMGCGGKIVDRFLLFAMEGYWHSRCLKCSCCQAQLAEIATTCFTKSGMILCRNDYIRLFGNSGECRACGLSIPANEMVMKAQGSVFHVKCFVCSTCHHQLVPGDRFHYVNGSLFCEHDRPSASAAHISDHLSSLQHKSLLSDQRVC